MGCQARRVLDADQSGRGGGSSKFGEAPWESLTWAQCGVESPKCINDFWGFAVLRSVSAILIALIVATPAQAEFGAAELAYSNGDIEGAMREFEKRGASGDGEALYSLGVIYGRGVDVPMDLAQAYKWICLSAHFGAASGARRARSLTGPLTHAKIVEMEEEAMEWLDDNAEDTPFVPCYTPGPDKLPGKK
jgi:hypothetical protein